ncbi:MAG: hypothetical protein GXY39_10020 [Actinomycetales bacterium]|nr:hypothetical protein [Actinomycetales bacterium]
MRGRPGGRLEAWTERRSPGALTRAEDKVGRLGPRAIILSYPVYGVSASSQIVSGGLRMRLSRFYLALGVVSLPWAIMQAIVGVAALQALLVGHAPALIGLAVVVILIMVLWSRWRRVHEDRRHA